jgi:PST family polysaccharide transporter
MLLAAAKGNPECSSWSLVSNDASRGTDASLGSRAARGAAVTLAGQAGRVTVQFLGIVLLARLLRPDDFGILAMVTAIVGIGEVVRDFGLSSAMIQAREVSKAQRDNLFWINSAIGAALGVVVCLVAQTIAQIYGRPELEVVAQALSLTFLFNGLSTQFRAGLNRAMKFGKLASIEIGGQAVGVLAGVATALAGGSYWALVVQQVGQAAAIFLLLIATSGWFPRLPRRAASMGQFFGYGGPLMGTQLVGYVSQNVDSVIIGTQFGATALGLYNRAFQLLMMPLLQINAPSTRVALPVLSRLKDDPIRFSAYLLRGQTVLLHIVVAIFAIGCAQAGPLIVVLLGDQWLDAAPIFQILAVAGVFHAASYALYWVFLAKGLTGTHLIFSLATRPLTIGLILLGAMWGPLGVATGYSLGLVILWPLTLWWIKRKSDAPVMALFTNAVRVIVGYGAAGIVSFATTAFLLDWAPVATLLLGGGTFLAAVALLALCWPRFREDIMAIIHLRSLMRGTT